MTNLATLPKGQEPMSEEKWAHHRDCDTASREHKWQWEFSPTGKTSETNALCVHCGKRAKLSRLKLEYVEDPS